MQIRLIESEILARVSTFFAGIFFASILLLLFFGSVLGTSIRMQLVGSFSASSILFLFLALSLSMQQKNKYTLWLFFALLFSAFVSFFVNLFLMLSLISYVIALYSAISAVALFILVFLGWLSEAESEDSTTETTQRENAG